jgi:hypothetical protein
MSIAQEQIKLFGYEAAGNINPVGVYTWDTGSLTWIKQVPITSGGGAVTIANGADVAEGATTDAAVTTNATGTVSGKLRGLVSLTVDQNAKFPAAVTLSDPVPGGNPTTTQVGANLLIFNGVSWNRAKGSGDEIDTVTPVTVGIQNTNSRLLGFDPNNGIYDRLRSKGDDVDNYATGGTGRLIVLSRAYGYREATATYDRIRSTGDDVDAVATGTVGRLLVASRQYVFNGATWDRLTVGQKTMAASLPVTLASNQTSVPTTEIAATLTQVVTGGANAIATATLPAVAGQFHYITHISIRRAATALLAGGALLTVTTTNLGGRSWRTGNQASITVAPSHPMLLIDTEYSHPLKSAVVNTATTIVCPAAGAAVSWHIVVDYFTAA